MAGKKVAKKTNVTHSPKKGKAEDIHSDKRKYLSQSDVPSCSLEKALKIAQALADHLGNGPATPLRTAQVLNQQPTSSNFRMLSGASIAYGLTSGGYNADQIALLPLGKRIVRPTYEGDDLAAKREALLKPRVLSEFLTKYKNAPIPRKDIAANVLEDLGVPREKTAEVFELIIESARLVGFIVPINGKEYFEVSATAPAPALEADLEQEEQGNESADKRTGATVILPVAHQAQQKAAIADDPRIRKVFVTHGKNKAFVEPIKQLLGFGEMQAVVSVERESVSQPVPDKFMTDMRSCGAAIIHVEDELRLMDSEGKEHIVLNENVLMEIGAALALYGRRFVLLVKEGVKLPSNTQGLYEVRYQGDSLSGEATIKLLKAIQDIKNHPLPGTT
jgi:predicted nucleotide-binding protein